MKLHHFVTANSCAGKLVYRMLFIDGEEREVPLPQPSLFSINNRPWSRSKEELDEQLRLLDFNVQHGVMDQRKWRSRPITTPRTTPGRPPAHIRTEVLLRHILGMPLHGRAGIDLHLGQKPKLGGRYADDSLIYISYLVGPLYIHVSFSLKFLFLFLLPKTQKKTKNISVVSLCLTFQLLALVCFTCYFRFDI
jgi:hypothetical protein